MLAAVTDADVSNAAFPFGHVREIAIAGHTVRALRVTYVGELGWELHVPIAATGDVFDALMKAGAAYGIRPVGYRALESLRLEKGYRAWGSDITPNDTPFEAGLGWAVKLRKNTDFLGRRALEKVAGETLKKRFAGFTVDDPDIVLLGRETILRNGEPVGYLTSGGYGYTIGKNIGYGYVRNEDGVSDEFLDFWRLRAGGGDGQDAGENPAGTDVRPEGGAREGVATRVLHLPLAGRSESARAGPGWVGYEVLDVHICVPRCLRLPRPSNRPRGGGISTLHRCHACFRIWLLSKNAPCRGGRSREAGHGADTSLIISMWRGLPRPAGIGFPQPPPPAIPGFQPRAAHGITVRGPDLGVHHPAALPSRDRPGTAALPDTRCAPGSHEGSDADYRGGMKGVSAVAKSFRGRMRGCRRSIQKR